MVEGMDSGLMANPLTEDAAPAFRAELTPAVLRFDGRQLEPSGSNVIAAAWGDRFNQPPQEDSRYLEEIKRNEAVLVNDYRGVIKDAFNKVLSGQVIPYDAKQLQLGETDPAVAGQVTKWELMSDKALSTRREELGNRALDPEYNTGTGKPDAENLYAVGFNKDGLPVNLQQYYRDKASQGGAIHYQRQFSLKYGKDDQGYRIEVNQYVSSAQPHELGPIRQLGSSNVEVGRTIYHPRTSDNKFQFVELYFGSRINSVTDEIPKNENPNFVLDLTGQTAVSWQLDASLKLRKTERPQGHHADTLISESGQKYYFFDLLGPDGQFRPE